MISRWHHLIIQSHPQLRHKTGDWGHENGWTSWNRGKVTESNTSGNERWQISWDELLIKLLELIIRLGELVVGCGLEMPRERPSSLGFFFKLHHYIRSVDNIKDGRHIKMYLSLIIKTWQNLLGEIRKIIKLRAIIFFENVAIKSRD